MTVAALRF